MLSPWNVGQMIIMITYQCLFMKYPLMFPALDMIQASCQSVRFLLSFKLYIHRHFILYIWSFFNYFFRFKKTDFWVCTPRTYQSLVLFYTHKKWFQYKGKIYKLNSFTGLISHVEHRQADDPCNINFEPRTQDICTTWNMGC